MKFKFQNTYRRGSVHMLKKLYGKLESSINALESWMKERKNLVGLLVGCLLYTSFIFFIYKKSYSGVMYSASFGVTLIALSLITTLLIMTVVSNIVLSLGMVGACLLYTSRCV